MNTQPPGLKYKLFGPAGVVLPGHPICIAYVIMHRYGSLEEARNRPTSENPQAEPKPPAALSDSEIPGAGGTVWAALDLLGYVSSVSLDAAIKYGNDYWRDSETREGNEKTLAAGQAQADEVLPVFREMAARWCHAAVPA